jgi:hypothetical protein
MTDIRTGKIRDEYLPVHVLSVIIEGTCKREKLAPVLEALLKVEKEIDTVFSLGIVSMAVGDGDKPLFKTLRQYGLEEPKRGKVNVGLGKPLFKG